MRLLPLKLGLKIIENSWVRSFVWRSDIFFYRVGDVVSPLVQILIWNAVFATTTAFAGYTKETMISYVLVSSVFIALSRNWASENVGREIKDGLLNQYLVKPVSYVQFVMWNTVGRTMLATLMALVVIVVLGFVYREELYVPDFPHLILSVMIVAVAFVMNILLSIAIGLVAFWITSVEGFSAAYYNVRGLLAGGMFPLNILSPGFLFAMNVLPFSYTGFVPTQVFLGKMTVVESLAALAVVSAWTVALVVIVGVVWRLGIKRYEAVGI